LQKASEKPGWPHWLIAASLWLLWLRLVLATDLGLNDDETYYRLWGLAPALSYLDHPGMTGWLIACGQALAGDTALGLRLAAVLAPLLGTALIWRTASILFHRTIAERAAWISLCLPLLAVGGIIMTPDVPSVMFWGLTGWAMAELYHSGRPGWWLAVGLFAGLGLTAKYTNLFAGVGIVLWLLLTPANRTWFGRWQTWAGASLALLGAVPTVVWNWQHNWASFDKQFGRVAAGEGITDRFLLELLACFAGLLSPAVAVLAAVGIWRAAKAAWRDPGSPQALLLCSILPLGLYLLVHATHDRVPANWPAPLYPALALFAALAFAPAGRFLASVNRLAAPLGVAFSGAIYLWALHPLLLLDVETDPTSQTRGWPDFASKINAVRIEAGAAWIATTSYATTGELAFALRQVPILQLNERVRYANLPPVPLDVTKGPALYVELARRADPRLLRKRFAKVEDMGLLPRTDGSVPIAVYHIYLVAQAYRDALASPIDPPRRMAR
jgi:Dolichyl-phosphate-mannose-protein mannosyltransferase